MTISDSTVSGNQGVTGGGIENGGSSSAATLAVTNSTISGNTGQGGGISNDSSATVMDSTISGNTGTGLLNSGNLTVTNSTVAGNTEGGIGSTGTLTVTNCTIAKNSATTGAGGVDVSSGTAEILNTIVAENLQGSTASDIGGNVAIGYNDLIGTGGAGGLSSAGGSGNIVGVADPLLGPLQNNGGPTFTMALLGGSPAINAGNNAFAVDASGQPVTTDQTGRPRIVGLQVDIGAYEAEVPSASISTINGVQRGAVTIAYSLTSPLPLPCSVTIEYSIDAGATWHAATPGAGGEGTGGLSSSLSGVVHTFVWSSVADIGDADVHAQFRVRATSSAGTGPFGFSNAFSVTNHPVSVLNGLTGQSGNVTVHYVITDLASAPCGVLIQYSADRGATWHVATSGAGGDGVGDLTTSPTGVAHTFTWASDADLPNVNANVIIRVTPQSSNGPGIPRATCFILSIRVG